MNRLAVVLAADSASTVTRWTDDGKEERYFKDANKIFQLSTHAPVGIMIFDSAEILRVPWEVIIKEFRKQLGTKTFNNVSGDALEFFDFLGANKSFFPDEVQRSQLQEAARSAAVKALLEVAPDEGEGSNRKDRGKWICACPAC